MSTLECPKAFQGSALYNTTWNALSELEYSEHSPPKILRTRPRRRLPHCGGVYGGGGSETSARAGRGSEDALRGEGLCSETWVRAGLGSEDACTQFASQRTTNSDH